MNEITVATYRQEVDKNIDENLRVIRTFYAVLYTVAFREVFSGLKLDHGLLAALSPPFVLSTLVLVLLAVRLFWAVGSIRRFIIEAVHAHFQDRDPKEVIHRKFEARQVLGAGKALRIMAFDVPVLFLHSFLFYLLCRLQPLIVSSPVNPERLADFVGLFVSLLLLNSLWLASLATTWNRLSPEHTWLVNNFVFALAAIVVYRFMPPAWREISVAGGSGLFWAVMCLFLANSLVDLARTSWAYLVKPPG